MTDAMQTLTPAQYYQLQILGIDMYQSRLDVDSEQASKDTSAQDTQELEQILASQFMADVCKCLDVDLSEVKSPVIADSRLSFKIKDHTWDFAIDKSKVSLDAKRQLWSLLAAKQ